MATIIFTVEGRPGDSPEVGWTTIDEKIVKGVKMKDGWLEFESMYADRQVALMNGTSLLAEAIRHAGEPMLMSNFEKWACEIEIKAEIVMKLRSPEPRWSNEYIDEDGYITRASVRYEE